MSERDKFNFKNVFRPTHLMLDMNGSHPDFPRGVSRVLRGFLTLLIAGTFLFFLCYSIIIYRVPNEQYTDAVREAVIAIIAFTLICKYIILANNRDVLSNLIRYMNDDFDNSARYSADEIEILNIYIKKGTNIINLWLYTLCIAGLVFILKGVGSTIYYQCKGRDVYVQVVELILPSKLEVYQHNLPGYCVVCILWCLFAANTVIVYNSFAPFVPILLVHCCGQLQILSLRLKNIFHGSKNYEAVLGEFKGVNVKLESIYRFVNDVQTTFIPIFEFTMKTTTIMLPFTAFEIVQALRNREVSLEFLFVFSCVLMQFYIPCYYSNLLMDESEHLRLAIYSCGWEKVANLQVRKILLFMLTRCTEPVVLNTFFYPICLETFAEMCRQSYAIYNIMVAAWN